MHHDQTRGKEKHVQYVKNTKIFRNQGGKLKKFEVNKFPKIGGNVAF